MSSSNRFQNQVQQQTRTFTIYTYNQSYVEVQDSDRNRISNLDTTYNWNDREDDWEDDKGGYENVELYCFAAGGRPRPIFKWYIERNTNSPLRDDNVFKISDEKGQVTRTYGDQGVITDVESNIQFAVNQDLLSLLQDEGVDTNPENGDFSFDLTCEVDQSGSSSSQGGGGFADRQTVRINVGKSYDNGALKSSTIGIIIGVVCAVILLVAAVALLLFAKSKNMWCFDDYSDANDPRSRPQQGGIPSQQPPAQVYRFISSY